MTTNKLAAKGNFFDKNKETILPSIYSLAIVAIMIVILTDPKKYNASVLQGLTLFFSSVLPGLFPFMILTRLLSHTNSIQKISRLLEKPTRILFGTSGIASYVFLMSAISGYPIGAKMIADLFEQNIISEQDAKKMCTFCTTSGPVFVIGTIGAVMFKSAKIGIIIYVSHILASIMCGIILRGKATKQQQNHPAINISHVDNIISKTVEDTVQSVLVVGAYITIFFLLSDILFQTKIISVLSWPLEFVLSRIGISGISDGFVFGLLEVTRGAKILSLSTNIWSVCFCAGILSLSGFSIIMQSMSFLSKCKIKARYFVFAKCVHMILTFVVCFCLCKLFIF